MGGIGEPWPTGARRRHRTAASRQTGKWGVEPNVTVDLTNEEMQQIVESRMAADRISGATTRPAATAPAGPLIDRQLGKALEVLQAKLVKPEPAPKVAASQPGDSPKAGTAG